MIWNGIGNKVRSGEGRSKNELPPRYRHLLGVLEEPTPGNESLLSVHGWTAYLHRDTGAELDLFIAAVALVHNLTLVTHNTKDYANIPGLTLEDWLVP